jgi:uncharacterized protein (DUF1810 family)
MQTTVGDDLARFVSAQAPLYDQVVAELQAAKKTSHWMWFVFPQLRGLGHSSMATRYGLTSVGEALAYWQHPILGARLRVCIELVLAAEGESVHEIFGSPDDMKLRSCLTLFHCAVADEVIFSRALTRLFGGEQDPKTLSLLEQV